MAKIIGNPRNEVDENENEEFASFDDAPEPSQQSNAAPSEPEDDGIPDKYRNKSIQDIVQMHQEAEKLLGRQSSEVGELRKIVDTFVQGQLAAQSPRPAPQVQEEEIDYFEDPKKAVERAIDNHPAVKQAQEAALHLRQQEAMSKLKTQHPDFQEILQDQGFAEWVKKSKIRQQLFVAAHRNFDFDAADELLSSWKERNQIVKDTAESEKRSRKQQVKTASTGNVAGSSESPSRKVYRRADIIKLIQTDPERYMALAGEIRQAYAEGRVK